MIDRVLDELAAALHGDGVRGTASRRVLAEARDHLEEATARVGEEEAIRDFGSPRELAGLVAAEVATSRTRSAAYATFLVLAPLGLAYSALYLSFPNGSQLDQSGGSVPGLGFLTLAGIVFLPQIAFVSGVLALLRAMRMRSRDTLSSVELRMQRARAAVASTAGILTLVSLGLFAIDQRRIIAGWWLVGVVVACAVLIPPLLAVGLATCRAARPFVSVDGRADDVFDDLAPLFQMPVVRRYDFPSHPWRFAVIVGLVFAAAVGPFAGPAGSVGEFAVLLVCFRVLGRPLGLRRDGARAAREDDEACAEPAASERAL